MIKIAGILLVFAILIFGCLGGQQTGSPTTVKTATGTPTLAPSASQTAGLIATAQAQLLQFEANTTDINSEIDNLDAIVNDIDALMVAEGFN